MKSRSVCLGLAGAFTLFLVGCGGGDGADGIIGTGSNEPIVSTPVAHPIKLVGAAQKGPYVVGSQVLLSRLLPDGTPSPETTKTEIEDDLGTFRYSVSQTGPVLITADGVHFNEITGKLSKGRLTLNALYNVTASENQQAYVNLLTQLTYKRALNLIRAGTSINTAIQQAEQELISAFSFVVPSPPISNFSDLNLYSSDPSHAEGDAYVLALSAIMYQYAMNEILTESHKDDTLDSYLTFLLNGLADDLGKDGHMDEFDSASVRTNIIAAMRQLRPNEITKHLEDRGFGVNSHKLPVANMDLFIDTDRDGIVNAEDNDIDNDAIPNAVDASLYIYSEAPRLLTPDTSQPLLSQQEILFSWETSDNAKLIEIQISTDSNFIAVVDTAKIAAKTYKHSFSTAGIYYLHTRAQNEFDEWGSWSSTAQLNIGVWTKTFGGSGGDIGVQIIPSRLGGVIVRGRTSSPEISSTFGATGDEWIFKVGDDGKIAWQIVLKARGTPNFRDMIELLDGSIIAVGDNFDLRMATIVKIDSHGNSLWESFYNPKIATSGYIYAFTSVVEVGGKLYVSALDQVYTSDATGYGYSVDKAYLHSVSPDDGTVMSSSAISISDSLIIKDITKLATARSGGLIVTGIVAEAVENLERASTRGGFIAHFDENLTMNWAWNGVGNYRTQEIEDIVELATGGFAAIGLNIYRLPTFIGIDKDGGNATLTTLFGGYQGSAQSQLWSSEGNIYTFLHDTSSTDSGVFLTLDGDFIIKNRVIMTKRDYHHGLRGFVKNRDGTFTGHAMTGSIYKPDIVLIRRDFNSTSTN